MTERVTYTEVQPGSTPPQAEGLTLAIRTDARHAVGSLKRNLVPHLESDMARAAFGAASQEVTGPLTPDGLAKQLLHQQYQSWGRKVLGAFADCLDYSKYGITEPQQQRLAVHFYDARSLADDAVAKGAQFVQQRFGKNKPPIFVSLDDMIEPRNGQSWGEVAFSRLFSADGKQQLDYVGRPGRPALDQQLDVLRQATQAMSGGGSPVPIVLVEDNVRHAKMLNWVIDKMERGGVLQHGVPAAIATCFIMADAKERDGIRYQDKSVPVIASVDYGKAKVDVITPRDMFFDGLVVQTKQGGMGRLPGVFLDDETLVTRFKIRPEKTTEFRERVNDANVAFCAHVDGAIGKKMPVSWFTGSEPICQVTGAQPERPMVTLLQGLTRSLAGQRAVPSEGT